MEDREMEPPRGGGRRPGARMAGMAALVALGLLASARTARAVGDPHDPGAGWAFRTDALMLWRNTPPAAPLYLDATTGATALSPSDIDPAMAAGPRYALFWSPDGVRGVEANYFRVQSWSGDTGITSPGNLEQNNVYGFNLAGIDSVSLASSSSIQGFELNARHRAGDRVTWLAGFRWVEWNDSLASVEFANGVDDFNAFSTQTIDNLYGGQAGIDMVILRRGALRLEGIGKAGVYYDSAARQRSSLVSNTFSAASVSASDDRVAFVGELGLTGVYDVASWLSLRAGYTMFWLGNVTAAAAQVQVNDLFGPGPGVIRDNASVFLNGITLGLEGRF